MSHDDFAFEPIPGLPARPPEGETILWQGGPDWRGLAWRAFHVREVAFYFGALVAAQPVLALIQGTPLAATLLPMTWIALAGSIAAGLLAALAWLAARGTVYTITNRRLVMRFGIALPMTINLPFALVAGASLKL
ncbi:MAG: photosynthetic complex putative assembly protein PuhB, partial [Hyphomicrobiales bacterium]